eukprot:TRINITY_DN4628_c0_g1_i2.p3 TRINITY_DN4628_c0_g1~~TRINITY_DN4628_c0_g1_i2.p3  ORF type:complete len:119 (+),score=16.80 TRINITY_DN4628_c0_g1_i2:94-450(+)
MCIRDRSVAGQGGVAPVGGVRLEPRKNEGLIEGAPVASGDVFFFHPPEDLRILEGLLGIVHDALLDLVHVPGGALQGARAVLREPAGQGHVCLLYPSDAADEEDSVDLGGRRIIKKKK